MNLWRPVQPLLRLDWTSTSALYPARHPQKADGAGLFVTATSSAGKPMTGPTKKSRTMEEAAGRMVFQAEPWDCERTQVFNALREFSDRHPSLAPTTPRELVFSCFNGAMPTAVGGHSGWLGKLQKRIGPRVLTLASKPDGSARWSTVANAVAEEDCSFPLIAVSSRYWTEVSSSPSDLGDMEHIIIVLAADKNDAWIFDCYLDRVWHSTRSKFPVPNPRLPNKAIVRLPMTRLIGYWEETNPPRFYFYFRRSRARTRVLSEFGRYSSRR